MFSNSKKARSYSVLLGFALRSSSFIQSYNRRPGSHVYATPYGSYGVSDGVSNVGAGGWRFV